MKQSIYYLVSEYQQEHPSTVDSREVWDKKPSKDALVIPYQL